MKIIKLKKHSYIKQKALGYRIHQNHSKTTEEGNEKPSYDQITSVVFYEIIFYKNI